MSCWHGWHGCGPYFGTPRDLDWWGPRDWDEEVDRPVGRRYRRPRRLDSEMAAGDLEARLEDLRETIRRIEAELDGLRGSPEASTAK